jgi:hypothetical protein
MLGRIAGACRRRKLSDRLLHAISCVVILRMDSRTARFTRTAALSFQRRA